MNEPPIRPVTTTLAGLLALAAALGIGRFVYTPILPFMVASLGLTKSQAGLIASANFLGYLVGALLAAVAFIPGEERRIWLLGALAASAVTTLAMGLTASLPVFLLLRFAGGIASAFVLVLSSALVLERLTAARRQDLEGLHFSGVGVGIALSAVLVSGLAAWGGTWEEMWIVSGLVALITLLAIALMMPAGPEARLTRAGSGSGRIDSRLAALTVAYGLFGFGYVITATFISTIVRTSAEISHLEPVVWLVVGLAGVPSVTLWLLVGRRIGNAQAFALSCVVEAVGVALIVLWPGTSGVILSAIFLGGTIMGITALGLVHARSLSTGDPARIMALVTAAFGLGQIIGPTFAGILVDATGSFDGSIAAAAAALLGASALGLMARSRT